MNGQQLRLHRVFFVPDYAETDGGCDDHDADADYGDCSLIHVVRVE